MTSDRPDEVAEPAVKKAREPRFSLTDDGNAQRFAQDHFGKLVYAAGPGWFRWTGKHWVSIAKDEPIREARDTARRIAKREADQMEDPDLAKRLKRSPAPSAATAARSWRRR
jgi:hypothetical protein